MKVVVAGAAGRMGRRVIANLHEDPDLELSGALEHDGSTLLGSDAGELAGVGRLGVAVTADRGTALAGAQVIIDFTSAEASLENAAAAAAVSAAAVVAATGHSAEQKEKLSEIAAKVPIVFAPNMSVGINLLFALLPKIARTLGEQYNIEVVESHHTAKKDAPSGTAMRLGEVLAEAMGWDFDEVARFERHGLIGARPRREIGMQTLRHGDVVGEHTVYFSTIGERIEVTHRASSRDTFALGAVRAAKWLDGRAPGLYDMLDVLGLGEKALA